MCWHLIISWQQAVTYNCRSRRQAVFCQIARFYVGFWNCTCETVFTTSRSQTTTFYNLYTNTESMFKYFSYPRDFHSNTCRMMMCCFTETPRFMCGVFYLPTPPSDETRTTSSMHMNYFPYASYHPWRDFRICFGPMTQQKNLNSDFVTVGRQSRCLNEGIQVWKYYILSIMW